MCKWEYMQLFEYIPSQIGMIFTLFGSLSSGINVLGGGRFISCEAASLKTDYKGKQKVLKVG